jgi:predicted MFS family arabinose efflux permease
MLSRVVTRTQLERGNSLLTTAESVGNIFLGAPLGAWLFAIAASLPLWANSGAYLVAAFLALTVAGHFAVDRSSGSSMREDMVEGMRWLAHHKLLRELMAVLGLGAAIHSMTQGILVLFALQNLGLDERGYGVAIAGAGVGAILGAMLSTRVTRLVGRTHAMGATEIVSSVAILLMAFWQHPVGGPLLFAISAGAISMFNVQIMSVRQAIIPEHLFGRVQGAFRTVIWGGIPVGMLVGGVLGGWLGLPAVFLVSGVAGIVVGTVVWLVLHSHRHEIDSAFEEDSLPG